MSNAPSIPHAGSSTASSLNPHAEPSNYPQIPRTSHTVFASADVTAEGSCRRHTGRRLARCIYSLRLYRKHQIDTKAHFDWGTLFVRSPERCSLSPPDVFLE